MHCKRLFILAGLSAILFLSFANGQDTPANSVIERFNKSLSLEAEGHYADALKELQDVPGDTQKDYLVSLRLGWLSYKNQYYDLSISYYQQAADASHNRSIEAMLGMTLPLAAKSDWARVEELYRRILSIDSRNYPANLHLGQIELNRGNYALADRYLKIALESFPGEYEANLSSAWNDYYLGRSRDAQLLFERSLMLSPGDTSATRGMQLIR